MTSCILGLPPSTLSDHFDSHRLGCTLWGEEQGLVKVQKPQQPVALPSEEDMDDFWQGRARFDKATCCKQSPREGSFTFWPSLLLMAEAAMAPQEQQQPTSGCVEDTPLHLLSSSLMEVLGQ
jgi:hypothetical protein